MKNVSKPEKSTVGRVFRSKGQNLGGVFNHLLDSNSNPNVRPARVNSEQISRRVASLPVAKARGAKKAVKRPPPSGIAAPPPEASMPRPNYRQQCCLTGKISLASWPPSKSVELLPSRPGSGPAMLEILCRFAQDKRPSFTRGSHSAWGRRKGQPRSHSGQASSRGPSQKATCLLANLSTMPKNLQSWELVPGQAQKLALTRVRVRSGSGCGPGVASSETEYTEAHNGGGSGGRRAPATRWSCPGAAHSTHPSRTRWSDHCGARDESTGRPDDSPR